MSHLLAWPPSPLKGGNNEKSPLGDLGAYCTPAQWNTIRQFCDLLKEANQKINLVSRKDIEHLLEHHVAPSFAYRILDRLHVNEQVLDIGSGGGFPGIINAILFPTTYFILVDSTKKKVDFLQQVIDVLGLKNVKAIWSRVEDLTKLPEYQHAFDRITSRAVAPLIDLVRWSLPLLKPSGTIEAIKGGDIQQEINTLTVDPVHVGTGLDLSLREYHLPENVFLNDKLRSLVIVSLRLNHR